MHRTIGYISKRFAQVRPGEGHKVLLTFLYFFFVITAYYVIKPVSRSLVLDELGHRLVPYADLITVICMGPILAIFSRMVDRFSKQRLIGMTFAAVIAITLLFWKLLELSHPLIAGIFYVWVAIFSVLVVTLFWLVANDIYRPREAKRLFGFIGSGGLLGGIFGSAIAAVGAQTIGANNLLLISAGFLIACWLVVQRLWRYLPQEALSDEESLRNPKKREKPMASFKGFMRTLLTSRYLVLLVAIVGLNKIVAKLIYYQFNPFIENTFQTVDAMTTFTSIFNGGVNAFAFIVQFFLTSFVLRRAGLAWSLLILPMGVMLGTVGMIFFPIFWLAAGTELYDRSLNYSINNTAKEVLYLPIDRTIRYKIKPFIDMVVYRFGGGVAAIIGIVLLDAFGMAPRYLSFLTIPLVAIWLWAVFQVRGEYTIRIRTMLQARAQKRAKTDGDPAVLAEAPAEVASALGELTIVRSPARKLALAAKLVDGQVATEHAKQLLERLENHERGSAKTSNYQVRAEFELSQMKQTIQNQFVPLSLRRQAVRLLGRQRDQSAVDYLAGMLVVEQEVALAHEATRELVKAHVADRTLQLPAAQLRRQIAREVVSYQRILDVARVYTQQRGQVDAEDPVVDLLRVLLEENVEQVFRLLMLLYGPQDIHLIYDQMQASDTHLRADAIELLDNLVDSGMRRVLMPLLDEDRFLSLLDRGEEPSKQSPTADYRVFQEAIWNADPWLSVTVLCAVGRLRLTTMRQELEQASQHTQPLVSTAARVALAFTAAT